jgi:hypothetical protein
MSLFVCTRCNGVDNTALAPRYWPDAAARARGRQDELLCTLCKTGEWHGRFPQRQYDRQVDGRLGAGRRIISPEMRQEPPCRGPDYHLSWQADMAAYDEAAAEFEGLTGKQPLEDWYGFERWIAEQKGEG